MKLKIALLSVLVSVGMSLTAQTMETVEFQAAGIDVIFKPSVKQTVSARLFVRGGVTNYPANEAGIERLAYDWALTGGTTKTTKDSFNAQLERMGSTLSSSGSRDYGHLSLNCLRTYWDDSWRLFAEAVVSPALSADEFTKLQERSVADARQTSTNPDAHLQRLAAEKTWVGSSFSSEPSGTPETLEALNADRTREFYKNNVVKEKVFLVVVGNLDVEELKKSVEKAFAALPKGNPAKLEENNLTVKPGAYVEDRDIETNYILGAMNAPTRQEADYVPNALAMSMLGDRYFVELRTKRSLSYAPAAFHSSSAQHPANMVYISTTDPAQSMEVMVNEINKVRTDGFSEKELRDMKMGYLTSHYMQQETNGDISMSLGVNEINGNWKMAEEFSDKVQSTSLTEVNNAFRKYSEKINWVYLGKEEQVAPENFVQPLSSKELKK